MRLYCVVKSSHSTPIGATPKYWSFEMTIRVARSSASVCIALVMLHSATAIIIQLNAAPPGTPRRVRAMTAAQIDKPVEAMSAAACMVVGHNTEAHYQPK
jgi:hypothetical protein